MVIKSVIKSAGSLIAVGSVQRCRLGPSPDSNDLKRLGLELGFGFEFGLKKGKLGFEIGKDKA
jgi:hypothetical protein